MDKKGNKIVTIKTFVKKKERITCLLLISTEGNKLQPYIIFKVKKSKMLYQEWLPFNEAKEKKIFLSTQENAWLEENLFIDYIKKVIVPYMLNKKNY